MERAGLALSLVACALAACGRGGDQGAGGTLRVPGENGPRVTVEVFNAGPRPGLARLGTRLLRQKGIDVLSFGNTGAGPLDSTQIIVRRGTADVGRRVRDALGIGKIAIQLDSTKLLDASVFLGADFAPRLQFHP